jgi:hypothetical protein
MTVWADFSAGIVQHVQNFQVWGPVVPGYVPILPKPRVQHHY